MPKTRQQKESLLQELTDRIGRSESVVMVSLSKLRVDEMEKLRDAFFQVGLQLQVPKNTLLQKVLDEKSIAVPEEVLQQSLALVYSYDDAILGPKTVKPFQKELENMSILGGIADGAYITPAQVEAYAALPSREQLLAQLVGTLNAPISGLVNVFAGNLRSLVNVMNAIKDAKPAA